MKGHESVQAARWVSQGQRMKLGRLITRRRAKWVGVVLCILLGAVFVASAWYGGGWWFREPNRAGFIGIGRGRLMFFVNHFRPPYGTPVPIEPFRFHAIDEPSIILRVRWGFQRSSVGFLSSILTIFTPLWIPLLFLSAPTAWLWYTDRRVKPWQCAKCRYDLRGLEGGGDKAVCPECGSAKGEV